MNRPDPSPRCETGKGNISTFLEEGEVLLEHRDLPVSEPIHHGRREGFQERGGGACKE
jgi:hypothetical protein